MYINNIQNINAHYFNFILKGLNFIFVVLHFKPPIKDYASSSKS